MAKDNYLKWNEFQSRSDWYENQSFYGLVYRVYTFVIGLIADAIIPFTFGSITVTLIKRFGKFIKIPLHSEVI